MMTLGLIVQTLIFSAAHSNYASKPAYARLVELLIPSTVFGILFLNYGFSVPILVHFLYDLFWFSIPIFSSNYYFQQFFIIFIAISPLFYHIVVRTIFGTITIGDDSYNHSSILETNEPIFNPKQSSTEYQYNSKLIILLTLLGFVAFFFFNMINTRVSSSFNISKEIAQKIATERYQERNLNFTKYFISMNVEHEIGNGDLYVLENYGKQNYTNLFFQTLYLSKPCIVVKFSKYDVDDVIERSENFIVHVNGEGIIEREIHTIPEDFPMKSLTKLQARTLIENTFVNNSEINELSVSSSKLPDRVDWEFVFGKNISFLKANEARTYIQISGDKIVDIIYYVYTSEKWKRGKKKEKQLSNILSNICSQIFTGFFYLGISIPLYLFSIRRFAAPFFQIFIIQFLFHLGMEYNSYLSIIYSFTETEPFKYQLIQYIAFKILNLIVINSLYSLYFGFLSVNYSGNGKSHKHQFLIGSSIAMIVSGLENIFEFCFPYIPFHNSSYNEVTTLFPIIHKILANITIVSNNIVKLLFFCYFLNLLTKKWKERKSFGVLLIFVANLIYFEDEHYLKWMTKTLCYFIVSLISYSYLFCNDIVSVIFLVVMCRALKKVSTLFFAPLHLDSHISSVFCVFFILIYGLYFLWIFERKDKVKSE
jgi:hypothetical protein